MSSQHRKMQAAVAEARVASASSSRSGRGGAKMDPVVRKASRDPQSAAVGQLYMPGRGVRYKKPTEYEALRTYVKHMSYRQLVEEFGVGHMQQHPRPPKEKSGQKNTSSPQKDASNPKSAPAGKAEQVPSSPRSPRSAGSSRRSSRSRSRSSSNASSPEHKSKDTPIEKGRTAVTGEPATKPG